MITYKIAVEVTQPADIGKRRWSDFTKDAHAHAARYWHEKLLPLHFKQGAASKYGYKRRSSRYEKDKVKAGNRRKARLRGRVALVFTGLLRDSMKDFVRVRPFPSRVTITMHGPRYVTMRPKSDRPDMAKEITTVTEQESDDLAEIMDQVVTRHYKRFQSRKKTTI